MVQKPKIQYVGEFYSHGSEARKLEVKKAPKTRLPLARLEKLEQLEKIYVDPVAIGAIVASLVLLVAMIAGVWQIKSDLERYNAASAYVQELHEENAQLYRQYRECFDLADVKAKALGLGLVPVEEVETMTVTVTMPQPEPEKTWLDELRWFWNGLWE